jgi:hypothetical protein
MATSTSLQTEFLLQFWKQREDSAILLASNGPQQEGQDRKQTNRKGKEKPKERTTGKNYEQVGLQEAPHLQDPKQNHFENAISGNSKKEFFFNRQPSSSL